jgi:hypothetical protein
MVLLEQQRQPSGNMELHQLPTVTLYGRPLYMVRTRIRNLHHRLCMGAPLELKTPELHAPHPLV